MADKKFLMLIINPGSTSTKFAIFEDDKSLFEKTIRHPLEDFKDCPGVKDQKSIRMRYVLDAMKENGFSPEKLDAVVGRGGITKPLNSGTYAVNDEMIKDLQSGAASAHASCLGGLMADDIAKQYKIPSFIVDPVVVDELEPIARLTGIPEIKRTSVFHALNAKAVARVCASELGMNYDDARFVVAHLGGGVTVSTHRYGRVIEISHGIDGQGPITPERCGTVPVQGIVDMCFSGKYTKEQISAYCQKSGGIKAYLGLNDMREVEALIDKGDANALLIYDAMAYSICKEIGAQCAVLEGRVDAIILTGGLAYSKRFCGMIKQRVDSFAPIHVYPGEFEMEALAAGGLRVLRGEEKAATY